jgi:hypothetical protein
LDTFAVSEGGKDYVTCAKPCGSGQAREEALTFSIAPSVVLASPSGGLIMPAFAQISRLSLLGKYR